MTWRTKWIQCSARVHGGADDTPLQLAPTARGTNNNVCMVRDDHNNNVLELAKGINHDV